MAADLHSLATVALVGRHEFDRAVVVPVVVPVHKQRHPLAGLVLAGKGPAGFGRAWTGALSCRFPWRALGHSKTNDPWPPLSLHPPHLQLRLLIASSLCRGVRSASASGDRQ